MSDSRHSFFVLLSDNVSCLRGMLAVVTWIGRCASVVYDRTSSRCGSDNELASILQGRHGQKMLHLLESYFEKPKNLPNLPVRPCPAELLAREVLDSWSNVLQTMPGEVPGRTAGSSLHTQRSRPIPRGRRLVVDFHGVSKPVRKGPMNFASTSNERSMTRCSECPRAPNCRSLVQTFDAL